MQCTICGEPIILVPSAVERARKHGGNPSDYTNLFTEHDQCAIRKRNEEAIELMKRTKMKSDSWVTLRDARGRWDNEKPYV